METQPVAYALRAIRRGAGVAQREMARRLGLPPSTYRHYEDPDRFKDPYLPLAWALKFADALEQSGVERSAVIALAGADASSQTDGVDQRFSRLSPRRQQMMLDLLSDLEAAEEADREAQGTDPDDGVAAS
ncbi:MAG: helix-turn-helix transcriptional regulator [Paracoccus sp. (in: a-proteobacteria)]|uniref:helix-turn-helix domain-containing protein n=1 Tax=Paracoccus sp. TaxID=267 RepID=UPI0026DFAA20|nr:helix-turn-helix transcriptional regulator [Paracoccus sp. (in: a-proteobacteria)]MDO5621940.1 helix-turn-helix transcriptional regulator [Paracoccus sp. (in: a-proteobacteria)]